jgi:hypothetical protein
MSQNIDSKRLMRCWTCHAPLTPQNGVELHSGVSIEQFMCHSCGRHWYGGERPRPNVPADAPAIQSPSVEADENTA